MAFKAFFFRITSSFKFCRSKNPSNIPENPIQLSSSPLFIDCQPDTPLPFKPHRSSFKHHVSSIFGCGFRTHEGDETPRRDYNSSISGDFDNELFPPPPSPTPTRHPITTSSADSGLCGYERDDEEEEIVTLASFSLNRKKRVKKLLPSFPAEGKVKDSFAVVKESVDPYEDFKASMMEMILAKQLFEERDLEQLLECFLSLNSRHHYGARVVWPLSDDSCRRVPHCISDYLQLTAKLPSGRKVHDAQVGTYVWLGDLGKDLEKEMEKYKIVVDNEWRHDEHQPFENRNYGTVNTVFLARESNYRLVRVSGGPLHEALPRVSEADLEIHGIPMAPLGDFCKGQFVGVLSALDFIMIVRELVAMAGPDENLKDVPLKILQNNVATVSVIHSSSGNASIPQLLHLASLSGILKCICRYFKHSFGILPMVQLPICAILLGTWVPGIGETNRQPLAMLRPHSSLGLALSLLVQDLNVHKRSVSSWFVCLFVGAKLFEVPYSYLSDINALAKDKIYTHINLEEMTINQLGQYSPYGSSSQRCHMCLRSDPPHKVMERLANPG
ncbi:unnamed protein product [Camellia sinensis]